MKSCKDGCEEGEVIDLTRYGIAIPGAIDIHEHLRGLDLEYKEDEYTAAKAAARGGLTLVIDMPNTKPRIDNIYSLQLKVEKLRGQPFVDIGLFVALPQNSAVLRELLKNKAVVGLKIYPEDLEKINCSIIETLRSANKLLMVHAEDITLIRECDAGARWRCRPIEAELKALTKLNRLVNRCDGVVRIHVTHVSNTLTLVLAKSMGFTTDTCPHYLYLSSIDEERMMCLAKVNPPLRSPGVDKAMLRYLRYLDAVSSDHAPHAVEEKLSERFDECPSGIASNELMVVLMLNLVLRGALELDDFIRLVSLGPASILGLEKWGCIDKGCIASYTILDFKRVRRVDELISKAKVSPYQGMVLKGDVTATIVRGRVVYLDGEFLEHVMPKAVYEV